MRLHSNKPGPPCPHMEKLLNKEAEGAARGLGRWYALSHSVRCSRCGKYLAALRAMIARLRGAKSPPEPQVEERLREAVTTASGFVEKGS